MFDRLRSADGWGLRLIVKPHELSDASIRPITAMTTASATAGAIVTVTVTASANAATSTNSATSTACAVGVS